MNVKQFSKKMLTPSRSSSSTTPSTTKELGPIVFCTPEIGRWSTVGGLGVMVDELSIGLADLDQEVYVISPYYNKNRKGETGYLEKDPAGIKFVDRILVEIGEGIFPLDVYEGKVKGVNVIFLHNKKIFSAPYPDEKPA